MNNKSWQRGKSATKRKQSANNLNKKKESGVYQWQMRGNMYL